MDLTSSDDGFWEQPESQSDPADMPSDDTPDAATYADSSNDDQPEESEGQLPELAVSFSDETATRQDESDNDELDRVSLAEIEQSNPFQIQSIEHDQEEETSSSAQQAVDLDTFSTGGETSSSQQSAETQTQAAQDKDLTFDQALAEATAGDELSDDPNETSGNDTKGALTFDEALAATKGTESITDVIANSTQTASDGADPTSETPVLDSLLPSAESVSNSLSAAFGEADDASNLTASSSNETSSSGVLSGLASSAVNAVSDKLSEAKESSESLLQEGPSSVQTNSSAVNTTRDFLSGAASSVAGAVTAASSAASGLLSNATSALSTTNTSVVTEAASGLLSNATSAISNTANSTAVTGAVTAASGLLSNASSALSTPVNTSAASATDSAGSLSVTGGAESDAILPLEMLNSTVLNSSVADGVMHSSMQKVGAAVSGAKSWLKSSSAEEDAVSAKSGATAGQVQEEPLPDLEQLESGEEEDLDAGTAGLLATTSTHAPPTQKSSSSIAAGSTPVHGSTQSRPAAQRPGRPAAQGTAAALANATAAQRAAAAELSTESDARLAAQTSNKAAGHLGNRQQIPRTADQQTNTGAQSKTGAGNTSSGSGKVSGGGTGHNSSTDAVVAAAMANPKSSASLSAKAAGLHNSAAAGAVAEEDDDQMVGLSQARSGASAAQSKGSAQSSALEAQRLRQEQEEEQEEEYLRRQARPAAGSAAGSTAKASQQAQPVVTAAQSARTGYADDGLEAASRGQVQSDFDDDYADEIAVGRTGSGSAAAAAGSAASQLAKSKSQLANSGFDNDDAALEEESYASGLQGSGRGTGTQAVPIRQSGSTGTTASQQSHTATGKQGALAMGESDPASRGQGSSQAGGWPHTGVSSASSTGIKSQPSTTTGLGHQYEDTGMAEEEEGSLLPLGQTAISHAGQSAAAESARATSRDQPNALPSSKASSGGKSGSATSSAAASDTRTPAQQRELEREMAFKASTGSSAHDLMDSTGSANSAASGQSWNTVADSVRGNTAAGASTGSHAAGGGGSSQSVNKRQQPLGGGESAADIGDYDPRGFAAGSTSDSITGMGQSASDALRTDSSSTGSGIGSRQGTALGGEAGDSRNFGVGSGLDTQVRSGFGDEEESDSSSSSFMAGRDPTDPTSVVGSQQSFTGQPHTVQQRTTATNSDGMGSAAAGQVAAGKTKMSLEPDEDEETPLMAGSLTASQALGKMNSADLDKSGGSSAGPVVTSSSDDEFVAHPRAGGKQSSGTSSSLHSLLDNIINNWVVITALSVCACIGAVLGFAFLRGSLPSPYDAVTFTNVGTAGYAGNGGGYTGVSREDQESGWENGWGNDDAEVVSPNQKRSSSNSPPRGTGVGKLKKGTFAKKKPANWSNDF